MDSLNYQKYVNQNKIADLKKKISACKDNYESLSRFKKKVQEADSNFSSMTSKNSGILSALNPYLNNNTPIYKFNKGMNTSLTSINAKVTNVLFDGLIAGINIRMAEQKRLISSYEKEINSLNNKIRLIDISIKKLEEQVGENG